MGRSSRGDQNDTEFITQLRTDDVLFGRGSGPNDHEGNIRFRSLVSSRKAEYLATNHRQTKAKIAQEIVDAVFNKNGRFLKRADTKLAEQHGVPPGVEAWCTVDDDTLLEKAKQALRQNREKPSKEEIAAAARKHAVREAAAKIEAETTQQEVRNKSIDMFEPLPVDAHGHQTEQQQSQQQKLLLLQQQQYQVLQQQQQDANIRRQQHLELAQQSPDIQQVWTNHFGNNSNSSLGSSHSVLPYQVTSGSHLGGLAAINKAAAAQQQQQQEQQRHQQRHSATPLSTGTGMQQNPQYHALARHSAPAHSLQHDVTSLLNQQHQNQQVPDYVISAQEQQQPQQQPQQQFDNTYGPSRGRRRSSVNMADLCELLGEEDTDDESNDDDEKPTIDLTNMATSGYPRNSSMALGRRASIQSVKMEDIEAMLAAEQSGDIDPEEFARRRQSIASIGSIKMEDFEGEIEDLRHGMRRMSTQSMGDALADVFQSTENIDGSYRYDNEQSPEKKMKAKSPLSTADAAARAIRELEQEERNEKIAGAVSEQEQAEMEAILIRQMMADNKASATGNSDANSKPNASSESEQLRNQYLLNQLMKETQRQQQLEQQQQQQQQQQLDQHRQQSMKLNEVFNPPEKGNNARTSLTQSHREEKDISGIAHEDTSPRPVSMMEKYPDSMNAFGSSSMSVMKTAMTDSGITVNSEQIQNILDQQQQQS